MTDKDWISVGDRLPDNLDMVLCWSDELNEYSIRIYNNRDWFDGRYFSSTMNVKSEIEPISHWTYLLEPPQ